MTLRFSSTGRVTQGKQYKSAYPVQRMDGSRRKAGGIGTVLPIPILAIRQLVCISCFKIPTAAAPLSKCGACKRVSYCSAACQKQNWSECHKKTCKILIASNKRKVRTTDEERTWEVYRQEKVRPRTAQMVEFIANKLKVARCAPVQS